MEQYINKDAIVTEIETMKSAAEVMLTGKTDLSYWKAQKHLCERLLSYIDTLEVKEGNNLENLFQALPEKIVDEKSHQVYELSIYHYDGQCVVDYVGEIDHDSLYDFGGNTLYEAIGKAWNWLRKNSTGG